MPALPLVTGCGCYGDGVERRRRSSGHPQTAAKCGRSDGHVCFHSSNLARVLRCPQPAEDTTRLKRPGSGSFVSPSPACRPRGVGSSHALLVIFLSGFYTLLCYLTSVTTVSAPPVLVCLAQSFLGYKGAMHSKDRVQMPVLCCHLFSSSSSSQPEFYSGRIPAPSTGTHQVPGPHF